MTLNFVFVFVISMILFAPRRKIMGYEHKKTSFFVFVVARSDEVGQKFVNFGHPNFVENENEVSKLDAGRNRPNVTSEK